MEESFGWIRKNFQLPSSYFQLFYVAYVFSQVGTNLWMFAILFILEELGGMRLVGIYQLAEGIFVMFLSAYVWKWMDKWNRKKGTLTVIALNNVTIVVSALLIVACLSVARSSQLLYIVSLIGGILFCAFSKCAGEGEKLSFTKDWIVVMAQREEDSGLSNKNAVMTIIEQASQIVAPIVTSYILVFGGYQVASFVFIAANLICWIVEYILLSREVNELHSRKDLETMSVISTPTDAAAISYNQYGSCSMEAFNLAVELEEDQGKMRRVRDKNICAWIVRVSRTFWRQEVFSAGMCLALMYMTVLGFDGLSISYGKAYGLSDTLLGWFKSTSALLGVIGALSYSVLEKKVGVRWTGMIGLTVQQIFLWFCVASIVLPGSLFDPSGYLDEFTFQSWWDNFKSAFEVDSPLSGGGGGGNLNVTTPEPPPSFDIERSQTAIIFYFVGVTFARIGVWITDLAIMQIMQEKVLEVDRLSVFGVENALCQFFFVGKDIMAIVLPDPRTYGILILISVLFVLGGFAFYVVYFLKTKSEST